LPDQDATEATTATVPEENGEAAVAAPEAESTSPGEAAAETESPKRVRTTPQDEGQNELVVLRRPGRPVVRRRGRTPPSSSSTTVTSSPVAS